MIPNDMKRLCVDVEQLLEEGVQDDRTYVVIDTYKFSTTVATALENDRVDKVYCVREESDLDRYKEKDNFLAGGEEYNDRNQPVGNSPTLVKDLETDAVNLALTSDNGAKRVHQLANNGAEDIVLGCLRNAGAVSEYLESKDWVLVPADAHNIPRFEDYTGAILISNLCSGLNLTESVKQSYSKRTDEYVNAVEKVKMSQEDWNFCIDVGASRTVPVWNSDGYFVSE